MDPNKNTLCKINRKFKRFKTLKIEYLYLFELICSSLMISEHKKALI